MDARGRDTTLVVLVIIVVIFLLLLLGGGIVIGYGMMGRFPGPGPYYGQSPFYAGPYFGVIMMAIMLLGIIGLVVLAVWLWQRGHIATIVEPRGGERALEILRERYARGEITREEYDRMREDILE